MARGWESKSVESQQEAATAGFEKHAVRTAAEQQIEALKHTRTRVLNEIAESHNPRFRELKQRALAHVEAQLKLLEKQVEGEKTTTEAPAAGLGVNAAKAASSM